MNPANFLRIKSGSSTVEYSIILSLVFISVMAVITIFLAFHQRSLIQSLAESSAQGLASVWGHSPLNPEDIKTGSYSKSSYHNKEVYWQIQSTGINEKQKIAESWVLNKVSTLGILKLKNGGNPFVEVSYVKSFPYSKVKVTIITEYNVPGDLLFRYIGMEDFFTVKGYSEAIVFDPKEMINNTDFIIQYLMKSELEDITGKLLDPIMNSLKKILGE